MRFTQSFTVARPAAAVWDFLQDVPAVASCLPGAELLRTVDRVHYGRVRVQLGPFKAAFEGEATTRVDPAQRSGHVEGRGLDRRGGSRTHMALNYRLHDQQGSTQVDIDVDLVLSGPIAQFGRTGLITETAAVMVNEFARNLETRVSVPSPGMPPQVSTPPVSVLAVAIAVLRSWFRRLF